MKAQGATAQHVPLLDQVLDYINLNAANHPDGVDLWVYEEHLENLLRVFNAGDSGILYEVAAFGGRAALGWAPNEAAKRRRELQR